MRMNLEQFKRHTGPVAVDDIDFSVFGDRPLDGETLRCLRYVSRLRRGLGWKDRLAPAAHC